MIRVPLPSSPASAVSGSSPVVERVLSEIVRDTHRYAPGLEPYRSSTASPAPGSLGRIRERCRDLVERSAARAGFTRRHFDPELVTRQIVRLFELSDGLEATHELLADEPSRRALVDLLKWRALGPCHSPLRVTSAAYRLKQEYADRELLREKATFVTSDPFFPTLSLYEIPAPDGKTVRLHCHSIDVVGVYLLEQYTYTRNGAVAARDGDVAFDVGACFGDTALYLASRVGPSGKVYAFEFDPQNLEVFRANLALNPELATRIEIVERAVWDVAGERVGFAPAGRCTSLSLDGGPTARRSVPTITLDDFVFERGIESLMFVKMDVEGAEPHVLRGASRSLGQFRPQLALAAYHRDDDLIELPRLIESFGLDYRFWLESFSALEDETVLFAAVESIST